MARYSLFVLSMRYWRWW